MEIIAKLFEKDGQNVWTSKSGEVFSVCVESNVSSLDLTTGFVRDEKLMFWVKANSEESAVKNAETIIKNINSGKLAPYRAFSETPFSSADTKDISIRFVKFIMLCCPHLVLANFSSYESVLIFC